ncbi:hypothetical protein QP551_06915 [Slackia exigua]|uniref:hypothetical protein n=1 Tax=Slackia exigua TaxID=84109 RepID=UPI00254B6315|nr:hypothetical protein [Slackia exigua]MDK7724423.1 hypothetical protein [Slackia exigua]MDK7726134.1 hypothetical protein [Slackia exigua]
MYGRDIGGRFIERTVVANARTPADTVRHNGGTGNGDAAGAAFKAGTDAGCGFALVVFSQNRLDGVAVMLLSLMLPPKTEPKEKIPWVTVSKAVLTSWSPTPTIWFFWIRILFLP